MFVFSQKPILNKHDLIWFDLIWFDLLKGHGKAFNCNKEALNYGESSWASLSFQGEH